MAIDFNEYSGYISQFCAALSQEVAHLKEEGGKKYRVFSGNCIYRNSPDFVYTFETDLELYLPDSSPVRLEFNKKSYSGEILSCEGFELTIIINEDIGSNIRTAEFSCEPWKLLEELKKRLEESRASSEFNLDLAYTLICEGRRMSMFGRNILKKGQKTAIKDALTKPVTIVWGPPGTGKTYTLAYIALKHYLQGKKVLIISHSNIAVDGAIIEIHKLLKTQKGQILLKRIIEDHNGEVLRYGYARKKELLDIPSLLSFQLTMEKFPELADRKAKLESERATLKARGIVGSRVFEIEKELREIRQQIRSHESNLVCNAKIVSTTISKATVDTAIYKESNFDVVLLDEASMAYIPQACFAAGLAGKHFICFGDFRQLAPIAQSNNSMVQKWLLKDIYEHLNIANGIENENYHPWLVLLNEQRRMYPTISGFVNSRVYHMQLCDHPTVEDKRRRIVEKHPFKNHAVSLIDLIGTCSVCSKSSDGSRYNLLSAFISFHTGITALQKGQQSIGIVTPYAAQSRLIRSIITDSFKNTPDQSGLSCATVHQFQGSEKDVIIFDCVDSYRQKIPGVLLTGQKNNNSLRLINVAVTRAKGKFIAVADRRFWKNKLPSSGSILRYLLDYIIGKGAHYFGNDLLNLCCSSTLPSEILKWYSGSLCMSQLLADLAAAKTEILMDIPNGSVLNEEELANALEKVQKRGVKVFVRAEKPHLLGAKLSQLSHTQSFAWSPVTVIDRHITWYGVPVMDTSFIAEGVNLPIRYWPVTRFDGEKTADTIIALLEMYKAQNSPQVIDPPTVSTGADGFASFIKKCNIKCKLCGSTLILKKGKKGSHFLACPSFPRCKNTKRLDKSLVDAYIHQTSLKCKEDGYPLVPAKSKYGIFARCQNANNSHCYDLDDI